MVEKKVRVKGKQKIHTFALLNLTAATSLAMARKEEGQMYRMALVMSSLVFSAFTLEATLNHIGDMRIRNWEYLERCNSIQKINLVTSELSIEINFGRRPWQTIRTLFGFRAEMAHGKTKIREFDEVVNFEKIDDFRMPKNTKMEKYCTLQNGQRVSEDVGKVITLLFLKLTNQEKSDSMGFTSASSSVEEIED